MIKQLNKKSEINGHIETAGKKSEINGQVGDFWKVPSRNLSENKKDLIAFKTNNYFCDLQYAVLCCYFCICNKCMPFEGIKSWFNYNLCM